MSESTDLVEGLRELLPLWRRRRAVELGDAVEALYARLPPRKIGGRLVGEKHEAWLELAATVNEEVAMTLVAHLTSARVELAAERLARLEAWPPNPAVARQLARMVAEPIYPSQAALEFWQRVLAIIVESGDTATIPILEAAAPWPGSAKMRKLMTGHRGDALAALRRRIAPALDDRERAELAALRERHGIGTTDAAVTPARSEEQLLAGIARDLDDDGPRLVYADWLSERGDPRGELITLACAAGPREITGTSLKAIQAAPAEHGAGAQRMAKLLRKSRKAWMGALADVIEGDQWAFDRGFLSHIGYEARYVTTLRSLIGAKEWSTLRSLGFCSGQQADPRHGLVELLAHPLMQNLRTLTGLLHPSAAAVATAPTPLPLTEVRFYATNGPVLLAAPSLPQLERITMALVRDVSPLVGAPILDQVRELTVSTGDADGRALLADVVRGRRKLARLRYEPYFVSFDLRGLDADAIEVHVELGRGRLDRVTAILESHLPALAGRPIARLRLAPSEKGTEDWRGTVVVPLLEKHAAALGVATLDLS